MEEWSLTEEQRAETVDRIQASISNLAFSRGVKVSGDEAHSAAAAVEKKAYTVARFEAKTTTGMRPHGETFKAYTRKLGNLVVESVEKLSAPASTTSDAIGRNHAEVLDLSGDREILTKEAAEEALAAVLAPGAAYKQIKLSTKSFGTDAAEVAARAIANILPSLEDADLSDIIAGRPEEEALACLRIMSQALAAGSALRRLNLSDNALGEKGVRAFSAGLSSQVGLEHVAFQNVGASIHACQAISELLVHTAQLRSLHLFNNMSDNEGAVAIAQVLGRAPRMQDFKMASSRVGAEGGIALAQALSLGGELQRLDLSDNPMTGEVAEALGEALRGQAGLLHVNLTDTSLGDDGIAAIAEGLAQSSPTLQVLELALNEVTPEGAKPLSVALSKMRSLQRLNLRENELEDRGAMQIAKAVAASTSLRSLDLSENQVRRRGAVAVARAVAAQPHFEELLLDGNEISQEGIIELQAILAKAGKPGVLGSLDENDADAADDEDDEESEDEEEQDGAADGDDDGLSATFVQAHISS